jgi:hypothetical protein
MIFYEKFDTLQAQVDALTKGTNPVVFFPPGTFRFPILPDNACILIEDRGTYYYLSEHISESKIRESEQHEILGFVQSKEQASKGLPILVVVCDKDNNEVKSAAVDGLRFDLIREQIRVFNVSSRTLK